MKWLILLSWDAEGFLQRIQRHHLTTDPACVHYVAPRPGSILDRWSRGLECEPCMVHRAFHFDDDAPWQGCTVPPEGWWCSREKGHEPPCAARPGKHPESDEPHSCESCPTCGVHGGRHDDLAAEGYARLLDATLTPPRTEAEKAYIERNGRES